MLFITRLLGILSLIWTKNEKKQLKFTLIATLLNLVHILIIVLLYDSEVSNFQFQLTFFGIIIGGIDGLSLWLILLVNLIIPIVILDSWKTINADRRQYLIMVLLVNFLSIAVFFVLDLLLFYISFEAILIPMYFLIGFYGSRNKKVEEAQNKFFIFTLVGSLFLLIALLVIFLQTGTTDYQLLLTLPISHTYQIWLWLAFFIAFAIKTPMWPLHIWLPVAHGESSTGTSVILAAILLKLGGYGFLRYSLPLFPFASQYLLPLVLMLAIISIIYSCLSAFSLLDLKSVIAYSSIAHMNVGVIGIFSNDLKGLSGAYLYLISHGLASSGLFLLAGNIYERYHTKTLKYFRGLALFMPIFITLFFIFSLSNISFPLSLGFIAEFMILLSTIEISPFVTISTVLVTILLPFYFIWTFQRISFGTISNYLPVLFQDTNIKEFNLLFPLLFLTILFGIVPKILLDTTKISLFNLLY
jgi:proton-translocating NADH-quinone oxidoreductase chain M